MGACYYCENGDKLRSLMLPIVDLGAASVYLFRDQIHKGKCIVVFNRAHKTEWFELTAHERREFSEAVAETAAALKNVFEPNKINYAIYGDLVSHFHMHVVPKYQGGPDWGAPFQDNREPAVLTEEEYTHRIQLIRDAILTIHGKEAML